MLGEIFIYERRNGKKFSWLETWSDLKTHGEKTEKSCLFNLLYIVLSSIPHEGIYYFLIIINQEDEYGDIYIHIHPYAFSLNKAKCHT